VDTTESSAPHAHPSTEEHDDSVEAHYACLEHAHACMDGWVFLGRVVESENDLDDEVVVVRTFEEPTFVVRAMLAALAVVLDRPHPVLRRPRRRFSVGSRRITDLLPASAAVRLALPGAAFFLHTAAAVRTFGGVVRRGLMVKLDEPGAVRAGEDVPRMPGGLGKQVTGGQVVHKRRSCRHRS
jgi:hypothetical protein